MDIQRNGSKPSSKGPAEFFTGSVRIDAPFQASAPGRAGGAIVTFEPGARTAWHTHPLGQTLIVTSGLGWTQCDGGPVEEIRPGDIVSCPPRTRHWRDADDGHDAYRHRRGPRRQGCRLDGAGLGRGVRRTRTTGESWRISRSPRSGHLGTWPRHSPHTLITFCS